MLPVAAIMVGDGHDLDASNRDIILRMRDGGLQRISETHPSYDPDVRTILLTFFYRLAMVSIPLFQIQKM